MFPTIVANFWVLLFLLVVGHNLADYPLQGEFLSIAKNHRTELGKLFWPYALSAHAFIHAGFVLVLTGSVLLALAEAIVHASTDWLKCEDEIGMVMDQSVHYACKLLWALIAVQWVVA